MTRPRAARLAFAAAALAAVAALSAGCGGADGGEREEGALVLAAASLTDVVADVDPAARPSFGGSNQLAEQIRQGAPFDVFLSASPRYTRALHRQGLVERPFAFARNALVVVVPLDNPAGIASVRDLERAGVRLVVAGPAVPIGAYTRDVLGRLGLDRALDRAVSLEPDVKGVVGKVLLGEADAGLVYATDARAAGGGVRTIRLPASAQPDVVYEGAVATQARSPAAAEAFVDALRGPDGRRALAAAGFRAP